ncbi:hypothetical protein RHSIM_Rhsim02G0058700 [Rhododendron simsii]|uniref:Leucine-rich repeat-containing N-terminal plant-type domain-containing protein n=1 Tax=Rhododendron simsii TaxID=118357 RepID=A0A834LVD7_RHOSS|nr:hypothetical protein RHSIM_Rhsim02G0058700 [Rhododendron simsii]
MQNLFNYLALALSAILVVFPPPSTAQPPQNPGAEALLRWKQSLANQTIVSSWIFNQTNGNSSASSPCNWRGISCNAAGNVTGLNLAYTGLQGTLDHLNFSYFPLLLRLDLKVNQLNGTIPTNIGLLSNLVYLDLSTNSFSGTIPLSVANLTKVVELDFSRNAIIGQLDGRLFPDRGSSQAKTGLLSLQRLLFQDTLLSGPLPPEIGNLEDLTILALDNSRFSGPIPQSLGNLNVLDPRLPPPKSQKLRDELDSILNLAVWCLRTDPHSRPTMYDASQVLEMNAGAGRESPELVKSVREGVDELPMLS